MGCTPQQREPFFAQKTMQRGSNGSDNLAEAVAKLCGELDHIAQDAGASWYLPFTQVWLFTKAPKQQIFR